ncbi:hypothetical protein [uncultured Pontibacter sp.]|uniref:hypothetical protein n=1 Tax=uncultured Pontibacter sp. TaxID=453356 RepID=UPI00261D8ABB|nr:hypothetical protein [uncultured Pontibacter sp.]
MNQEGQNKGGVNISGVSGSSIIVGSPHASITVNNSPDQLDQVNLIIDNLKSDSNLKDMERMEMLELMIELKSELRRGPVTDQSLIERIATVGSGIATVATYLRPLLLGFGVVI